MNRRRSARIGTTPDRPTPGADPRVLDNSLPVVVTSRILPPVSRSTTLLAAAALALLVACCGSAPASARVTTPSKAEINGSQLRERAGRKIGLDLRALATHGAPPADQRAFLTKRLRARGIGSTATSALVAKAIDGVSLKLTTTARVSHLGGNALVTDGEVWPTNDRNGTPLSLLAVFDLAELKAPAPLPPDGALALYFDTTGLKDDPTDFTDDWMDVAASAEVRWIPAGTPAHEVGAPKTVLAYPRQAVKGTSMAIFGGIDWPVAMPGSRRDIAIAGDTMFALMQGAYTYDQLLGSSQDIQGPILDEIEYWFRETSNQQTRSRYSADERHGKGWTLLAQISGGGSDEMTFADAGNVFFAVPTVDLAARRFDRAIGILQPG